ncbi:MAG: hypothetical protein LBN92_03485 [Treponema sp.]|nr:hypothetical protein [Treponema sp.]
MERLDESDFPGGEGESCRRYTREIADSEDSIRIIQGALRRIRELDEEISVKKQEKADREDEANLLYLRLGCRLLAPDGPGEPLLASARRELSLYRERGKNLGARLDELEEAGNGFLIRLGAFFQSLVIRWSLKRNEKLMDRVYLNAGRIYGEALDTPGRLASAGSCTEETALLIRDTIAARQYLAELDGAVRVLEREKEKIGASFGFREKPARRIKQLEEQAEARRGDLRGLYRRIGEGADQLPGLEAKEEDALRRARDFGRAAGGHEKEIARLEAAIEADREAARIVRLEKTLAAHRSRVASGEKNIAELDRKIAEGRRRVSDLRREPDEARHNESGRNETVHNETAEERNR